MALLNSLDVRNITVDITVDAVPFTTKQGTDMFKLQLKDGSPVALHTDSVAKFKEDVNPETGILPVDWKVSKSQVLYKNVPMDRSASIFER